MKFLSETELCKKSFYLECLYRRNSNREADKRLYGTWQQSYRALAADTKALVSLAGNDRCQRTAEHVQRHSSMASTLALRDV